MSITIKNKTLTLTSEAPAPFTWSFVYDGNCIAINIKSEMYTTQGTNTVLNVVYDVILANQSCLENAALSVQATDSSGCPKTLNISIPQVCNSYTLSQITALGNYRFGVVPMGGSGSYTYEWTYDNALFQPITSLNQNQVQFSYVGAQPLPDFTTIGVKVRDANGCELSSNLAYYFCKPQLTPKTINLSNTPTSLVGGQSVVKQASPTTLSGTLCPNTTLDYSTFSPTMPAGYYYQVVGNAIKFGTNRPAETVTFSYTIKDSAGTLVSSTITLVVPATVTSSTISIPNATFYIDCDLIEGNNYLIPIQDLLFVQPGAVVDWDSFTLIASPTSGTDVSIVVENDGKRYLEYLIPADDQDVFTFSLEDTDGNLSNQTVYTIMNNCLAPPDLDADSACVACGSSVVIAVLDNDEPNAPGFILSSVIISTPPAYGTATPNADGTITYTAPNGFSGTIEFGYKVTNTNGVEAAVEGEVDVEVRCAGIGSTVIVCA